jgi:hypothetical protein
LVKKFDRMLYKNYILSVLYERQTMGHTWTSILGIM